jgi:hypothetical protein
MCLPQAQGSSGEGRKPQPPLSFKVARKTGAILGAASAPIPSARPQPVSHTRVHYPWGFDTIGHLGLIYLATAIFVVGAALSGKALLDERTR